MWHEKCDRCQKGDENRWKGSQRAQTIKFVGEFVAIVCPECRNEWAERLETDADYEEFSRCGIRQRCAIEANDPDKGIAITKEGITFSQRLFVKAREFVAENVTRGEPEESGPLG